jgi:chromosome segregation ATPase
MSGKNINEGTKSWFWRKPDGAKVGPFSLKEMRDKVLSGDIDAQTSVSADDKSWALAALRPELGFECIILEATDGLNVLGPFAQEAFGSKELSADLPADGIVFVRSGLVKDGIQDSSSAKGSATGVALTERIKAMEKQLRDSEKARSLAEASLAARDLEFDSERQKLNGVVSGLKAAELKLKAEVDDLRSALEASYAEHGTKLDFEAKLVDAENSLLAAREEMEKTKADALKHSEKFTALKKELEALKAESEKNLKDSGLKTKELEKKLSDASKRLTERDSKCVELEGDLENAKDEVRSLQKELQEQDKRVGEYKQLAETANSSINELNEAANWLRTKLTELADEATDKFYVPELKTIEHKGVSENGTDDATVKMSEAEVVEPEIVSAQKTFSKGRIRAVSDVEKISAIENQLHRELSGIGAKKARTAEAMRKEKSSRDGFIGGVFRRKK